MGLGGGTFVTVGEKTLPGSYINFVSASRANFALSERGYVAIPLELDWGEEQKVVTLSLDDFRNNSLTVFGYNFSDDAMKPLREIFRHAQTVYFYRLGTGTKAASTMATAKYAGTRGNKLKVVTTAIISGETTTGYTVKTFLDDILVDTQEISGATATTDDLAGNDFVDWIAEVSLSAGTVNLSGGANATITSGNYSSFLAAIEPYSFNVIGYAGTDSAIKALFAAFTQRLRDSLGIKFQCVLYQYATANYEGVVSVENNSDAVYWTVGALAGCAVNKSVTNAKYDGEYEISTNYTQEQLETALKSGKFVFHKVGEDVRVLEDINTLTTFTEEKSEDFKENQTIRVIDQIGNDIAAIFNTRFLGIIPNDNSGRAALWNEIVKHHSNLQAIGAIENFSGDNVTVQEGNTKRSVVVNDVITPINCMTQLYMTCKIS
ncbi:MAG: phage tail sheath family protein [Methanobrevibacter sp.]|nr:phage tail sheath family protein [Methanobrevibacter sp.]